MTGPGEDGDGNRGRDQHESDNRSNASRNFGGSMLDDDIHADLTPFPGHGAAAGEHAADHEEEHDLLGPRDRDAEEVAADDVGEIDRHARDQEDRRRSAGEREEPTNAFDVRRRSLLDLFVLRRTGVASQSPITGSATAASASPRRSRPYRRRATAGLDFETSSPTLASVCIIFACSSAGRLINSPPFAVQAWRALLNSSTAARIDRTRFPWRRPCRRSSADPAATSRTISC